MKEHFGVDDAGLTYLSKTATLPWDEFWVPGGKVEARAEIEPGLFVISQLLIGRGLRLWISADGVDTGIQDEVFFITCMRDERFGEPAYEAKWRPRRARLGDVSLKPAPQSILLTSSPVRTRGNLERRNSEWRVRNSRG